MPPKKPSTIIFLALEGEIVDSAYATAEGAKTRVSALSDGTVQEVELVGGSVVVVEEKAPKAAKAKKEKKVKNDDDEEGEEDVAPKEKKKTKTPAEQRAKNAEKPGKVADEDLPENVKALLGGMGKALDGMTIVVTGIAPTLGRKNAEKLVVNYGGKITKSLSKNTNLVFVGNDAGPTKLEKIEELGIKTVDEDEFIALLEAGGTGLKRSADSEDKEKQPKTKKPKK